MKPGTRYFLKRYPKTPKTQQLLVLFVDFGMLGRPVCCCGMPSNFFEDSNGSKEIFPAITVPEKVRTVAKHAPRTIFG